MLHGLHLNFDFSAFCSVFIAFILVQVLTWEKSEMQFAFVYIMASVRSRCVCRDDPAESQQFHVWVKVSFSSVISQRNYKGKTVDGATADWNPAEAMLARLLASPMLLHQADILYMFQSDLAGGLGSCPSRSRVSDLVFGRIWGQEGRLPFRPSLATRLFRQCNRTVRNRGLFSFSIFFDYSCNRAYRGQDNGVKRRVCVCVCMMHIWFVVFYVLWACAKINSLPLQKPRLKFRNSLAQQLA